MPAFEPAEPRAPKRPFILGWPVEQPYFVVEFTPTEFEHYHFSTLEERDFVRKYLENFLAGLTSK
jgi:hypothetical protein